MNARRIRAAASGWTPTRPVMMGSTISHVPCSPDWTGTTCQMSITIWDIIQKFSGSLDMSSLTDITNNPAMIGDCIPVHGGHPARVNPLEHQRDIAISNDPVLGNCFTFNDETVFENTNYLIKRSGQGQGLLMSAVAAELDCY
ncbi:unnamed protein product [Sphagnum balticum]